MLKAREKIETVIAEVLFFWESSALSFSTASMWPLFWSSSQSLTRVKMVWIFRPILIFFDLYISAMGWYYMTTLIIVAILNASNGLYQNSIFGERNDVDAR